VTVRLLKRSARKPPVIENRMNGIENSAPATKTSRSRSAFASPVPRMMKTTRFLYALSLNAPWNWVTTSVQNPRCHDAATTDSSGRSEEEVGCSNIAPAVSSLIRIFDKRLKIREFCTSCHNASLVPTAMQRTPVTSEFAGENKPQDGDCSTF